MLNILIPLFTYRLNNRVKVNSNINFKRNVLTILQPAESSLLQLTQHYIR
jgi:hypothetical protein